MSTNTPTLPRPDLDHPDSCEADAAAVLEQFASGRPLDASVAARVHARAAQVTEDIRRTRGLVDDETFQSLLDDEA